MTKKRETVKPSKDNLRRLGPDKLSGVAGGGGGDPGAPASR